MIKVSIIIPCLNSVNYIKETMDSVVNQTLHDIEILVIDAGSTDGTLEILDDYAHQDNRVKIIHSDKKSMGYQYNLGMDMSNGEYIGFLETDDYVALDMYETLYHIADESHVDYIKADFEMFIDLPQERLFINYGPLPRGEAYLYGKVINPRNCLGLYFRDYNMWNGIYNRNFIINNHIRLNETAGAAFQDCDFVQQTLILAHKAMYIKNSFYRYRRDNENSSIYSPKTLKYIMDEFLYMLKFVETCTDDIAVFEELLWKKMFGSFCQYYKSLIQVSDISEDMQLEITNFRRIITQKYEQLGVVKRSIIRLDDISELIIFLKSMEEFRLFLQLEIMISKEKNSKNFNYLKAQKQIVIFGCGEFGSSFYCLLRRNNINDAAAFCDNNVSLWNTNFMGRPVLSPYQVTQKFPEALYVIPYAGYSKEIMKQLMENGITQDRIYYGISVSPHGAMEPWRDL